MIIDIKKKEIFSKTKNIKSLLEEDLFSYYKKIKLDKELSNEDIIDYMINDLNDSIRYVLDKTPLNGKEKRSFLNKLKDKL